MKLYIVRTQRQTSGDNLWQDYLSTRHLSRPVLLSRKSANSNNPTCAEMNNMVCRLIDTACHLLHLPAIQGTVEWYAFEVES